MGPEGCVVTQDLPAGLLSVHAPGDGEVWITGASPEPADGTGPVVLRGTPEGWERYDTSAWAGAEIWWAHVTSSEAVLVGTDGLILELDRATGTIEAVPGVPEGLTFFGVWGATAGDVWAVGQTDRGQGAPVLWRREGGTWAAYAGGDDAQRESGTYFKVHGTSASDVWVVGSEGVALHFDGAAWALVPTDADTPTATSPLLTVNTGGPRPMAVGGTGVGLLLEYDGEAWRNRTPDFQPGLNGVCARGATAWAVGVFGSRSVREEGDEGAWRSDSDLDLLPAINDDWHACAVTEDGDVWMVGGRIASRPLIRGVGGYVGAGEPLPITL